MKFVSACVSTGFKSWMKNLGLNPVYKSNNYDANVMPWGQIFYFILFLNLFIYKNALPTMLNMCVCIYIYIYVCVCVCVCVSVRGDWDTIDSQSVSCCNGNGSIY